MAAWSGLFDHVGGAAHVLLSKKSPNRYHLARMLRKPGLRELGEALTTLLDDSSPATTALVTKSRVTAVADTSANVQGGVRAIESQEKMSSVLDKGRGDTAKTSRAVTAADVTTIQGVVAGGSEAARAPSTYPTDKSGNGGGDKQLNG